MSKKEPCLMSCRKGQVRSEYEPNMVAVTLICLYLDSFSNLKRGGGD